MQISVLGGCRRLMRSSKRAALKHAWRQAFHLSSASRAAPSSPSALCVSHLQHLAASSFSLNLPHTYRCSRWYLWKICQRWRKWLPSCSHHPQAREGLPLVQIFHYVSGKVVVRVRWFNLEVIPQISSLGQTESVTLSFMCLQIICLIIEQNYRQKYLYLSAYGTFLLPFPLLLKTHPAACRVRCLQFLPTLSLFVLLSLDIKFQAPCWWHLAPHMASVTDSHTPNTLKLLF